MYSIYHVDHNAFCFHMYCWFQFFCEVFAPKGYPFKNIFYLTTASYWDCVAAVERLPALHYSVDFIFLSFGIMGFIVELSNYKRVTDDA